jgi:hypothetical protein
MFADGYTLSEIAKVLLIDNDTVQTWINAYKNNTIVFQIINLAMTVKWSICLLFLSMANRNDPVAANKIDPVSTKKYQELSFYFTWGS